MWHKQEVVTSNQQEAVSGRTRLLPKGHGSCGARLQKWALPKHLIFLVEKMVAGSCIKKRPSLDEAYSGTAWWFNLFIASLKEALDNSFNSLFLSDCNGPWNNGLSTSEWCWCKNQGSEYLNFVFLPTYKRNCWNPYKFEYITWAALGLVAMMENKGTKGGEHLWGAQ